jgi:hypothetical protein
MCESVPWGQKPHSDKTVSQDLAPKRGRFEQETTKYVGEPEKKQVYKSVLE